MSQIKLIESREQLDQQIEKMQNKKILFIDTEFKRKNTFFPELSLVQIYDGCTALIIDAIAISELSSLWRLINDSSKTKVFHSLHEDIENIYKNCHQIPENVIDTQIAAAMLNIGFMIGYSELSEKIINVKIDKQECKKDWMIRPLSESQIDYAAKDVIYLKKIFEILKKKLQMKNVYEWVLDESCAKAKSVIKKPSYRDIKGYKSLNQEELKILQKLSEWLFIAAKIQNLPKKKIISNKELIRISQNKQDASHLEYIEPNIKEYLAQATADHSVFKQEKTNHSKQKAIIREAEAVLIKIAKKYDIHQKILFGKKEVKDFAAYISNNKIEVALYKGWRKQICEDHLKLIENKYKKIN